MSSNHHLHGERDLVCRLLSIIDGRPWNARHFKNNNLRHHARMLGRIFQKKPNRWTERLAEPCAMLVGVLAGRCNVLTMSHHSAVPCIPVLLRAAWYRHRWIRMPDDWHPQEVETAEQQLMSLIRHLFARYEVPAQFEETWLLPGQLENAFRGVYCHVAQGGSVRTAPEMRATISKRAAHLLMTAAPKSLNLCQAVKWSQAKSLGAEDFWADFFATSTMGNDWSNDRLWLPLMEMVLAAREIDPAEVGMIIDHLYSLVQSSVCPADISLKGKSLSILSREAANSYERLLKIARDYEMNLSPGDLRCAKVRRQLMELFRMTWKPQRWIKPFRTAVDHVNWEMVELCSQHQLSLEGDAMNHCVGSYGRDCMSGEWAVFSLRFRDECGRLKRKVTLEIDTEDKRITEARERWNARLDPESAALVRRWAKMNGISSDDLPLRC